MFVLDGGIQRHAIDEVLLHQQVFSAHGRRGGVVIAAFGDNGQGAEQCIRGDIGGEQVLGAEVFCGELNVEARAAILGGIELAAHVDGAVSSQHLERQGEVVGRAGQ